MFWAGRVFRRFGAKRAEKCDFCAKSAHFREKVRNFAKFPLFGPEITFWAPRDPRTLVNRPAGVRIHFSGRKRGGRGREGEGGFILYSLPRPISSSQTLLLLPHPFSLLKLIQYHSGAKHLVALKVRAGGKGRVFRSPGVGAGMFALLPTLWVFHSYVPYVKIFVYFLCIPFAFRLNSLSISREVCENLSRPARNL